MDVSPKPSISMHCAMFRDSFDETTLFRVKHPRDDFVFFVRLLAGNILFYFSRKHDSAIPYSVDITYFESRRKTIDLDMPAGGRPPP